MRSHVQKWGNSLGLRVPKAFADGLGLVDGSPVVLSLEEGVLVVKPDKRTARDLESLLAEVTDENVHPEWETEEAGAGEET